MRNRMPQGFTLVEMSIVLVVIGLIAAGVLVGRDLIRHAELVKLHGQYTEIVTAIQTFKTKYNCLPGDCPNATDFFGSLGNLCPNMNNPSYTHTSPAVFSSATPGSATCNGDGDGRIDAGSTLYEMLTLWQQLATTGLIGGSYTGGAFHGSLVAPGYNCPLMAASSSRCWVVFDGDNSSWLASFPSPPPVTIVPVHLGTVLTPSGQLLGGSLQLTGTFTPAEAMSYDAKYDDGSPVSGNILIAFGSQHCTNGNAMISSPANATAQYLANDPVFSNLPTCNLVHRAGF